MALTVLSIATDSNFDVRQAVGTGAGVPIQVYAGLIDRIHKDCVHSSVYSYINIFGEQVTTAPGVSSYLLGFTPVPQQIRRVLNVYDRTRDRLLFPLERAVAGISLLSKQELNPGQQSSPQTKFGQSPYAALSLQTGQPEYWKHRGPAQVANPDPRDVLVIFPTPKQVLQLDVAVEGQVPTLTAPTDTLMIPEDGRDMVVAGVNYLVNLLVKRMDEAQTWAQIYERLKKGDSLV